MGLGNLFQAHKTAASQGKFYYQYNMVPNILQKIWKDTKKLFETRTLIAVSEV